MLHTLSNNIAEFLLSKNCFEKDNLNIYVYGTELVISSMIGAMIVFLLSVLTNSLLTGLLFYLSFNMLRAYTGGLHCKTYLKCNITFAVVFMTCLITDYFVKTVYFRINLLMLIVVLTFVTIVVLSPVENPNKPIEDKDRKKYRIISLLILISHIAFFFLSECLFDYKADIIIITDFITSILMVIGFILNRRCNYENG